MKVLRSEATTSTTSRPRAAPTGGGGSGGFRVAWSVPAAVSPGISFDFTFGPGDAFHTDWMHAKLHTAIGTTMTLVVFRKNGNDFLILNMQPGVAEMSFQTTEYFVEGDVFSVGVSAAGTGASGLQTITRFVPTT